MTISEANSQLEAAATLLGIEFEAASLSDTGHGWFEIKLTDKMVAGSNYDSMEDYLAAGLKMLAECAARREQA